MRFRRFSIDRLTSNGKEGSGMVRKRGSNADGGGTIKKDFTVNSSRIYYFFVVFRGLPGGRLATNFKSISLIT